MAYTRKFNKENENRPFPSRLRRLAEKGEASQAEIARYVGCTPQAIGAYMRGETVPKLTEAQLIADYFNVSLDYLSGRSDIPTSDETMQGIRKKTELSNTAIENLCKLSPASRRVIDDLLSAITELESIALGYELMKGAIKTKKELLNIETEELHSEIMSKAVDDIDVYRFRLAFQFAKFAEKEQED